MAKRNFFYGTMNASKSAQLLMQAYNLERQGKSLLVFKPSIDTRDKAVVKSRALDEERKAFLINKYDNGLMYKMSEELRPDFIFVDECQFMTKEQVKELAEISIELDIPIFAYGLLLSYTGELFDGSKTAIECGFTLFELKMQCDFCRNKSTHHLLYIDGNLVVNGDPIHVGDQEYKSCCYPCYIRENNKYKM